MQAETGLVRLDAARRALSEARTLEDIKSVRDQAEAIRSYMKAQGYSLEMQNDCAEIGIRAERAMGELLPRVIEHGGDRRTDSSLQAARLKDLGVNETESHRAQLVADVPEETFEQHIAETKAAKRELSHTGVYRVAKEQKREAIRESNRALVIEPPPLPPATFQTIVLDPPWDWGDEGDVSQFGRGDPAYATLSIEELLALPVATLSEPNAHIYLWITNRSLPKGFALLERWGFRYITTLTWCKPSIGMGNYFRGSTEHVLFGVRGSLPLLRRDVGTWFEWPRGSRHSDKPGGFFALVEDCSPGPWLEMFARTTRPGWTAWGVEA
jgi:N6-adenosine-specific RNA methylase IME4